MSCHFLVERDSSASLQGTQVAIVHEYDTSGIAPLLLVEEVERKISKDVSMM
jgi:hypothetical protein